MPDKYNATWVSHSSISDYLACPRTYYLKNVYKDPNTNRKIKVMSPALALGQAVHDTLESLSVLKREERFSTPLPERFAESWKQISGKKGGFFDDETELKYRKRGEAMIARVYNHPGPVSTLAVKISDELPHFWLSEEDEIILCGKIDWLEYLQEEDAVHIIDFKTGKYKEKESSLQLPIYLLLVSHCQQRPVVKASYWYLEHDDELQEKELPNKELARQQILSIAQKIKLARKLKKFDCVSPGDCRDCFVYERILKGEGDYVGQDMYGADTYVFPPSKTRSQTTDAEASLIL